jgi:hypothetical protein
VHERALAAVQERACEVIDGAFAGVLLTAVALQAGLVVVRAPGTDVVALTAGTWLSCSSDHGFGEEPDRRFSAHE